MGYKTKKHINNLIIPLKKYMFVAEINKKI